MRQPKKFIPYPFEYHQEIELTIETLTNLGVGIGRINNWVVMVPFTIPGEQVKARIYKNHKNYSEADLLQVLTKSTHRIPPTCELFQICGGCQYQHIEYEHQLIYKQRHVKELLDRALGMDLRVCLPIPSPEKYFYRAKITPHFPKPPLDTSLELPVGFLKYGSTYQYVDVPFCPIATKKINEVLPSVRKTIKNQYPLPKNGGTVLLRETADGVIQDPNQITQEKINNIIFEFKAGDFFQNNLFILPLMVEYVVNEAKGEGIEYLIDAYCGSGLFCLSGFKDFKECYGIEINESAIKTAKKNAELNNILNCKFIVGSAENIFGKFPHQSHETTVIIDPPRKGCDTVFLEQLISFQPNKIVYISCDPATQARDVKFLIEHQYVIKKVQPFDLFPQTRHIENIITLEMNRLGM